jgi:hypothetical protein
LFFATIGRSKKNESLRFRGGGAKIDLTENCTTNLRPPLPTSSFFVCLLAREANQKLADRVFYEYL